jgi:hypothetical protein
VSRPTGDDALAQDPFDWRTTTDGRVFVSRGGRQVVTVAGAAGRKLAAQLDTADAARAQQLLARATGNYRRGNERHPG